MKAGLRWIAMSLPASSLLLSGCAPSTDSAPSRDEELRTRLGVLERRLVLSGTVKAVHEQAALVPREAAWRHPIRWLIESGEQVEEGDLVVEFDNQQAVQQLQESELRVISAFNDLVAQETTGAGQLADKRIDLARKEAERDKAALEAAVPQEMRALREWQEDQLALKEAETALAKARDDLLASEVALRADIEVAELQLAKAERDRDTAAAAIELLSLEAPAPGLALVGDHPWEGRPLQLGDTLFAGHAAVTIPDLREMQVEAWLSDVDDGLVQPGMSASAVLDAHPGRQFMGEVVSVAPVASAEARSRSLRRSFLVTVALRETDPELMIPGMSVRLEVDIEALSGVLLAPRRALARSGSGWRARVDDGSWAEVELGPCDPFDCLVLSGLEAGLRLARADTAPDPAGERANETASETPLELLPEVETERPGETPPAAAPDVSAGAVSSVAAPDVSVSAVPAASTDTRGDS